MAVEKKTFVSPRVKIYIAGFLIGSSFSCFSFSTTGTFSTDLLFGPLLCLGIATVVDALNS